jgi:hypothetical protein
MKAVKTLAKKRLSKGTEAMQNLYTEESYNAIDRQLKRRLALFFAVEAVLVGLFIWALVARIQWAAMVFACLAGCFGIFFLNLFCAPLSRYRRLVRGALSGRSHEKVMEFVRREPDRTAVDGVSCHSLIFLGDADKHGDRETMLYWDSEIPLPEPEPGRTYRIRYTGRIIIGIEAVS